jgi:hypothetical protein
MTDCDKAEKVKGIAKITLITNQRSTGQAAYLRGSECEDNIVSEILLFGAGASIEAEVPGAYAMTERILTNLRANARFEKQHMHYLMLWWIIA